MKSYNSESDKKLAKTYGLTLSDIVPSRLDGKITIKDVKNAKDLIKTNSFGKNFGTGMIGNPIPFKKLT